MKAIETRYHGPTNTKGARITASDSDGNRVTISYPHELSGEDCHRAAADALCAKMGWHTNLVGGGTKRGYVFVFVSERNGVWTCMHGVPATEACTGCQRIATGGK